MKLLLVMFALSISSCALKSREKGSTYQSDLLGKYDHNALWVKDKIIYNQTEENNVNCFGENLRNKEVVTVNTQGEKPYFVIDFFHRRISKLNISLSDVSYTDKTRAIQVRDLKTIPSEEVEFVLEMESCGNQLTSFRLKD